MAIFRSVSEILKAAKEFAKQSSFDHEKARTFLAPRDNFGASQLAEFHATKVHFISINLRPLFILRLCYLQFRAREVS